MPGLSILYDLTGTRDRSDRRTIESLVSLKHYEWYEHSVMLDDARLFLGWTGYREYPTAAFEKDDFYICLEGSIYGIPRADTKKKLRELAALLSTDPDRYRSRAARWLSEADGDFLIFILNRRSGEMFLVNDALGRLPVYYHETGESIIVSRELRFVSKMMERVRFDPRSISQYLLLGYPLADKTLFDGISRLNPASVVRADPSGRRIRIDTLLGFNAEEHETGRSPEEQAELLAESLCRSCSERAADREALLVALSGGLDSRTVAACLAKNGAGYTAITFLDHRGTARPEVKIAREVADVLGCDWRMIRTNPATGGEALRLLRMKSGMNFLGMSFSLPLCLELRNIYGPGATLFTGDGGDKLLPDIKPPVELDTVDSLANYIASKFCMLPLDIVSDMTMIDRGEILAGLTERLGSYAERDTKMKCVHFLVFERNFKWLFEGEDRNRCHLWVVSPFYSLDCFTKALRCPGEYKERYRLYRDVLRNLSPEATAIDYAKWMVPIGSRRIDFYWHLRHVYLALPPAVRRRLKRIIEGGKEDYGPDSAVIRCLDEQLERCGAISDYLSVERVRRNLRRCSKIGLENLFTITSVIEDFMGGVSTIEEYSDSDLIG